MRLLAILFFPFALVAIILAMLVAPLVGAHFCPAEALPLLGLAGAGTAGLPLLDRFRRRQKPHCCDPQHKH